MTAFYAGIGARKTPSDVCDTMTTIAQFLAGHGYTLRSGGAEGADEAFERGAGLLKEIYLPWPRFRDNPSTLTGVTPSAMRMAEEFHPAWHTLSQGGKKLMARNCYQILGYDLATPCKVVVCWTPHGGLVGGTSQAIRIAVAHGIPVFNLGAPAALEAFRGWCRKEILSV